ncbi:MAG TPA: hypothetical protein VNF07_01760, partial [Acidimicrobiales bacterium]|nr:hypothetical protein [Acidimicrobiales bacterium]
AKAAGLREPRITSDVKHVEIGLTDKSDSARFAAGWLAERGITGELIALSHEMHRMHGARAMPSEEPELWTASSRQELLARQPLHSQRLLKDR